MREAQPDIDNTRRRFEMVRSFAPADLLTLCNAACGTLIVFMCLNHLDTGETRYLWIAFALFPAALALDAADGWVARLSRRKSNLGADLDSLADIVSFGVGPAVLGYTLGLRGGWDVVLLVYFVACGISRLARYNVTVDDLSDSSGKVRYYQGAPIPASLVLVALLAAAYWSDAVGAGLWLGRVRFLGMYFHPLALAYLAVGSAMISSRLRIPKP